ncbi:hypothetical protein Q428_04645 [Fervidicella metallireducens AeB]|uniref:Uncharacterized protein n=1 Tax=Fervidicella metallireducens AeB TaxID=1403537 RepID=A0A017RYV7_9CLOT|nr:hypothetical protein [Fervidicella metallireducens]EYE89100.1 hypothetical protein Q428_04645 [Fervidicella metallireducens AeB]
MGIFKSIGRLIGKGIEKVGDFFGSEKISNFGRKIQDACAEKIAAEKSYDKKEADIYTTDRLNEILVSFSEGYFQQATSYENACIKIVEEYYDKLISIIEDVGVTNYNEANLKSLRNGKKRIAKSIIGAIKDPLAKRMSLDDSECLSILKMDSGLEKKQAMTNFTQKVIKEALNNLSKNVRETLKYQIEDIQDYLNNILEEQEKEIRLLKEHFDKLIRDNELMQSDKEKSCVLPLIILEASERVCEILK